MHRIANVHRITEQTLPQVVAELGRLDPDFAAAAREFGLPPLRAAEPGFGALMRIIVAQQVSLASAAAIWTRLLARCDPLTPRTWLEVDEAVQKEIGLSRPKMRYARILAEEMAEGRFDTAALARMDDAAAMAALVALKGIGPWSAQVYLLFAEGRPDVWPADDVGLMVGAQKLKKLPERPDRAAMIDLAEPWRPLRSVAARMLWHVRRHLGLPDPYPDLEE